jgi:hypothetical protein
MFSTREAYDAEIGKLLERIPGGYEEKVQELNWIDSLSAVGGDLDTTNAADSVSSPLYCSGALGKLVADLSRLLRPSFHFRSEIPSSPNRS